MRRSTSEAPAAVVVKMSTVQGGVQGRCSNRFEPLRQLFEALLASGDDLGASLALTVNGRFEVDLWGGWMDEARTRPWTEHTVVNVWSTTKTVTSLAALLLVDRGELDVDKPIAHYWPEFAAAGKQTITLGQVLDYTSGVSGWDPPFAIEDMYDWERSTARLAAQAPWWPPGTASGYHALNHGHLIGEVVRRITGRGLKAFVETEIAKPLDADFHIGLPESEAYRCCPVVPPPPLPIDFSALDPNSPVVRTFTGPLPDAAAANTPAWRAADIGAANGHGNARSVAKVQSVISNGGEAFGVRLLRHETVERIFTTRSRGVDLGFGGPVHRGMGWGLPEPSTVPYVREGRVCFWGGWGGSMVINDADRKTTLAYMMNRMAPGIIGGPNIARLAACLNDILR